jgi:hypothetical protein
VLKQLWWIAGGAELLAKTIMWRLTPNADDRCPSMERFLHLISGLKAEDVG